MIRRLLFAALASVPLVGLVGCHHKCCSGGMDRPQPYLPPPPGGPFIGPPGASSTIPPTSLPTTPSTVPSVTPGGPGLPPPELTVPRNYGPAPAPGNGRPAPEVLLPDPLPPGGPSSRSLYPAPNPGTPPFLGPPVKSTTPPPAANVARTTPTTGLPGFTKVKDGVATGRKPTLDGFDSLKQGRYRTVAYLYPSGADVSAARDLAEKRGFAFVAIETTPENLPDALRRLNQLVADRAAQPVYVSDDDGLRAGALWYLHFRTVDALNDDAARI